MLLTPRLALAAKLCSGTKRVIDVGCDHAYLSIALAKEGVQVEASDLRPGPLEHARAHICAAGLEDKISLTLCDGLSAFSPADGDTVVICGMGGETIADILADAPWTAGGDHTLVLQPQTRADTLRRFLAGHGYTVEEECLAREGGHLYCVLRARGGKPPMGAENDYICTEKIYSDPQFPEYLALRRARLRQVAAGKRRAGHDTAEEERILKRLEALADGAR
ncbi:MAG: class I SAM-dependent methyltransferase [Clostridiaceae bacterium]|nr:class I SAM-dependent methyltransferase [Clostridiaceae bacterium]